MGGRWRSSRGVVARGHAVRGVVTTTAVVAAIVAATATAQAFSAGFRAAGTQPARARRRLEETRRAAQGFAPLEDAAGVPSINEVGAAPSGEITPLQRSLRVKAIGGGGGFILEFGGLKLLVNPVLSDSSDFKAEDTHKLVDYVVLTSAKEGVFDPATLERMNLMKVSFVADGQVGLVLEKLMVRNLAVLGQGRGGRALLTPVISAGAVSLGMLSCPGAEGPLPWSQPETGFLFVNMKTGIAVAYEALGKFLGTDASSTRDWIPEEAYQADYLVTPDLVAAAGICRGLASKGAELRAVVLVPPFGRAAPSVGGDDGGILGALDKAALAFDRSVEAALGIGSDGTSDAFRAFLASAGGGLAGTRLAELVPGGGFEELEVVEE